MRVERKESKDGSPYVSRTGGHGGDSSAASPFDLMLSGRGFGHVAMYLLFVVTLCGAYRNVFGTNSKAPCRSSCAGDTFSEWFGDFGIVRRRNEMQVSGRPVAYRQRKKRMEEYRRRFPW